MRKVAIFVEGQTELIFIRESLPKLMGYQHISFDCYTLQTDSNFQTTDYSYPITEETRFYFQIINVGGDNAVISRLLRREQFLLRSGFELIIGLRDMYSQQYRRLAENREISNDLNQQFINAAREQIEQKAERPELISFLFAIMEIEAWFLGCEGVFEKVDARLTNQFIAQNLGFNLSDIDPEETFFHPANAVEQIFDLVEKDYKKGSSLVNNIDADDLELLHLNQERCASFSAFYEIISMLNELE
ncbi:MAG: DUF4276 family protein [Saprospiraceae bacterium]